MARTGMAEIITKMRRMCELGTADYTVAGTTYWTDDQVEEELDRHFLLVDHARLSPVQQLENGTLVYKEFFMPDYEMERNTGGNSVFRVTDSNGSAIGTANYTVNYEQRRISFTTDQQAELRYLTANAYDLHATAEEIWTDKAGHYQASFDFATDNHDLKRSQLIQQATVMATFHRKKKKARTISVRRLDVNGWSRP